MVGGAAVVGAAPAPISERPPVPRQLFVAPLVVTLAHSTTSGISTFSQGSSITQTPCLKLNLEKSSKTQKTNSISFDRARSYSTSSLCSLTSTFDDHSSYEEMELAMGKRGRADSSSVSSVTPPTTGPFNIAVKKRHTSADANIDVFRGIRSKHEVKDHKNAQLEKITKAKVDVKSIDESADGGAAASANGTVELVVKQTMNFVEDMLKKWQEGGVLGGGLPPPLPPPPTVIGGTSAQPINADVAKRDDESAASQKRGYDKEGDDVSGATNTTTTTNGRRRHHRRRSSSSRPHSSAANSLSSSAQVPLTKKNEEEEEKQPTCGAGFAGASASSRLAFDTILELLHREKQHLSSSACGTTTAVPRRTWSAPADFLRCGRSPYDSTEELMAVDERGEDEESEEEQVVVTELRYSGVDDKDDKEARLESAGGDVVDDSGIGGGQKKKKGSGGRAITTIVTSAIDGVFASCYNPLLPDNKGTSCGGGGGGCGTTTDFARPYEDTMSCGGGGGRRWRGDDVH